MHVASYIVRFNQESILPLAYCFILSVVVTISIQLGYSFFKWICLILKCVQNNLFHTRDFLFLVMNIAIV